MIQLGCRPQAADSQLLTVTERGRGKRSRVDFYGEFWQAKTRSIWRHKKSQPGWLA